MKIALLGAPQSGKTVYWTALYREFKDDITYPALTPALKTQYRKWGVKQQIGFRMDIGPGRLLDQLKVNAKLLDQRPIAKWPRPTGDLDTTTASLQFDFVDIASDGSERSAARSYQRELEVYDPPGGVFGDAHSNSAKIIESLQTCDASIVFLPIDAILPSLEKDEVDVEDLRQSLQLMLLTSIKKVLLEIKEKTHGGDVFPVCFVVSKADICLQDAYGRVEDYLYNRDYGLISRLSRENPDMLMCVCPISVVNPETGNFKAMNLEWPFLFSAAATIYRNHRELTIKAERDYKTAKKREEKASDHEDEARSHDARAEELSNLSWWQRFKVWAVQGERVGKERRQAGHQRRKAAEHWEAAQSYRNSAGRKIELANDDKELSIDVLASLSVEGKRRNIAVLLAGR